MSIKFLLNPNLAARVSFSRTSQFEYRISNSISPFTTLDIWLPSHCNFKPQVSDQVTGGICNESFHAPVYLDADVYFWEIYNYISYTDHAYLLFNPFTEGQLRYRSGKTFGFELLLKKSDGRFNGWISYSFTHTRLQIHGEFLISHSVLILNGHIASRYTLNYRVKPRWSLSAESKSLQAILLPHQPHTISITDTRYHGTMKGTMTAVPSITGWMLPLK